MRIRRDLLACPTFAPRLWASQRARSRSLGVSGPSSWRYGALRGGAGWAVHVPDARDSPGRSVATGYLMRLEARLGRGRPRLMSASVIASAGAASRRAWRGPGRADAGILPALPRQALERAFGGYDPGCASVGRASGGMGADTAPDRRAGAPRLPGAGVARARPVRARDQVGGVD